LPIASRIIAHILNAQAHRRRVIRSQEGGKVFYMLIYVYIYEFNLDQTMSRYR